MSLGEVNLSPGKCVENANFATQIRTWKKKANDVIANTPGSEIVVLVVVTLKASKSMQKSRQRKNK